MVCDISVFTCVVDSEELHALPRLEETNLTEAEFAKPFLICYRRYFSSDPLWEKIGGVVHIPVVHIIGV